MRSRFTPFLSLPRLLISLFAALLVALFDYLTVDPRSRALEGRVTAATYPEGGEGRIADITP